MEGEERVRKKYGNWWKEIKTEEVGFAVARGGGVRRTHFLGHG